MIEEKLRNSSGALWVIHGIGSGKLKIKIFKKYKLEEVIQAHQDLEGRKILGPAVIVPN